MQKLRLEPLVSWLVQRSSLESGPWSHLCPCSVISLMDDYCHFPLHHHLSPVHWLFSGPSGFSIAQIWPYHSRSWNSSMTSHCLSIKSRLLCVAFFICSSSPAFSLHSSSKSCQVPTAHTLQPWNLLPVFFNALQLLSMLFLCFGFSPNSPQRLL